MFTPNTRTAPRTNPGSWRSSPPKKNRTPASTKMATANVAMRTATSWCRMGRITSRSSSTPATMAAATPAGAATASGAPASDTAYAE